MRQMTDRGRRIENGSFEIIDREAGSHSFRPAEWEVVRRVIHATADFEFKELMHFHPDAIRAGIEALKRGCPILVDVKMITAGLNQDRLDAYGCKVYSFISDPDVIKEAQAENSTRAIAAMQKAHRLGYLNGAVVAIGNAPTALMETVRLIQEEGARPALVVGVPVGFVSAAESKEMLLPPGRNPLVPARSADLEDLLSEGRKPELPARPGNPDGSLSADIPFIVSRGRKGGSPIAVAIIHALLLLSKEAKP